jgi:hypothetical protein
MSDVFGIGQTIGSGIKLNEGMGGAAAIQNAAQLYNGINPQVQANQGLQGTQQGLLNNALSQIQNGGLNAQSLGQLNQIRAQQNQSTHAGQAAALSQAQQQGTSQGNSGVLGSMVAGQQAANIANQQGFQTGQQALQNGQAMLGMGSSMANNLQGQNLGIQQQNFNNQMSKTGAINTAAGNVANAMNNVGTNAQNFVSSAAGAVPVQTNQQQPPWATYYGANGNAPPVTSTSDAGQYSP